MDSLEAYSSSQFAGEMDKKGGVGGDEEMMIMENTTNNNNNNKNKEEEMGEVVISVEKMLMELPRPMNPESFIYKVSKQHRKMNETVYTPQFISIGPFHHGQPELMAAEQYKLWALEKYLSRANMRVEEAIRMAYSWEEEARSCYGHPIHMSKQDFAKMMLLDGCFILEFLNSTPNNIQSTLYSSDDIKWIDIALIDGMLYDVRCDLTMFENQLPFFVLQQLYDRSVSSTQKIGKDSTLHFMECVADLFVPTTTGFALRFSVTTNEVRHLLDLLRFYYTPSPETDEYKKFIENEAEVYIESPTITQLCEAGVKIQKAEEAESMMDFSFKNGVLKIPPIVIDTKFETHIRNLIVSEIFSQSEKKYVFHYIALLDDLINTENDVSILTKEKIIFNDTGRSCRQVSELINNLRLNAPTFPPKFYYFDMSKDLHDYYNKWWNRSVASLRRDYFNTPWASISFVAGTFLIILTFLQTLFSVPSISHK